MDTDLTDIRYAYIAYLEIHESRTFRVERLYEHCYEAG
jgi:hypothetical protein